jgi:histidyl-tRNA synthetase
MEVRRLKGIREYGFEEQILREKIVETLKKNFKRYGYMPIETSILDFYDIAVKKYGGEEIIKEIYRLKDRGGRDLCLRYELTFKLAKFLALNQVKFPFKRYEIGKVFRDGPVKKGRLREFTQCDVDCIGVKELWIDAELMALAFNIFNDLSLDVLVKVNNRKFLFGLMKELQINNPIEVILSLDKLDKYSKDYVIKELEGKISKEKIEKIFYFFDKVKNMENEEKINFFKENLKDEEALEGLKEIEEFFYFCNVFGLKNIYFVPSLARGLAYYDGLIWEFYLKRGLKSSVAAGGRWNGMISSFLNRQTYATGMSFGLDTIYEALKEKKEKEKIILIIPLDNLDEGIKIAQKLRKFFNIDIINKPLAKALDYANKRKISFCIILGKREIEKRKLRLKFMETGKEKLLSLENIIKELKKLIC